MNKLVLALIAGVVVSIPTAEAAPFSIRLDSHTGANGKTSFTIVGDTTSSTANLTYDEIEQNDTLDGEYSTSFTDYASQLKLGPIIIGSGPAPDDDMTYARSFVLSNSGFDYRQQITSDSDPNISTEKSTLGYSLSFELTQTVYTTGQPSDLIISGLSLILNSETPLMGPADLSVSPGLLSPVPLPSGLPLFASALVIAAGATGVARHRRRRAEATA